MPYYFHASDAVILSYEKGFLGGGSIIFHAGQFALPVIACDIELSGDFVGDYNLGLTFAAEDPHSLREAISSFLSLKEEEKQVFKDNLLKFASAHSWEQWAKEHLELYKRLLQDKGE